MAPIERKINTAPAAARSCQSTAYRPRPSPPPPPPKKKAEAQLARSLSWSPRKRSGQNQRDRVLRYETRLLLEGLRKLEDSTGRWIIVMASESPMVRAMGETFDGMFGKAAGEIVIPVSGSIAFKDAMTPAEVAA